MIELQVKLARADFLSETGREKELDLIDAVDDGALHEIKLTTNKIEIDKDKRDNRFINAIRRLKIVYKLKKGGCLLLMGKLTCSYASPYGGEFFVTKAVLEENTDFKDVKGVKGTIRFTSSPVSNDYMHDVLPQIVSDEDFEFNMSQFEDFMDIFGFYKAISSELKNNVKYRIRKTSDPFWLVPVDEKEIETEEANALTNSEGIITGYILEKYKYEQLDGDLRDRVRSIVRLSIDAPKRDARKIRSFAENLFLANDTEINDSNSRQLVQFHLVDLSFEDNSIVLYGEYKNDNKYAYLHLYDMGQKIKLESINESLRLINQGETGSASQLLEYLIGDSAMPTKRIRRRAGDNKDLYLKGLDESQKKAFLMATDGSPVSLIKGPPGTGKTHVINAIVQYITKELHEKVVISSQTHVAIDNVLDKLMENYDLIIPNRITNRRNKYSGTEIDVTLYKTWAKKFSAHNERSDDKSLASAIAKDIGAFNGDSKFRFSEHINPSDFSVIGATTTTSAIGGKRGQELLKEYDWLVIDEVSKCPITEVLRYLPYVKKIIMVGDDFQLAPLLEFSKEEVQNLPSYDEDKFDRLKAIYEDSVFAKTLKKAQAADRLVQLNVNYRSVSDVLAAYNIFYENSLVNMREKVKPQKVMFNNDLPVLNNQDIFFVNVKNGKEAREGAEGTSRYNVEELQATAEILEQLIANTMEPQTVSVSAIFPYAAQIKRFQKQYLELINRARKKFKVFEIDTVDAFQGRETDIVLVNTVVTDEHARNFLDDFRRINVSMSRARDKLFIFGNPQTLSKIDMKIPGGGKRRFFADIIEDIKRKRTIIEYAGGLKYDSGKPKIEID